MKRQVLMAAIACAMLTGCGKGSEDFTIAIDRPANQVISVFGDVAPDPQLALLFHDISIRRSTPAEGQVLYTIPGTDGEDSTILLTFEPGANGASTILHAAVDVPAIQVAIDGLPKVVSETKIERQLQEMLDATAARMKKGQDGGITRQSLSGLFSAVAIVTNKAMLSRMLKLKDDPSLAFRELGGLTDDGAGDDADMAETNARGDAGRAGEDPNAALRKEQWRAQAEEARERRQQREAAEPMDDARGESAKGEDEDSGW